MLAPELSYFVCILGGDAYVCDERRQAGLPALTIQCDAPLNKPKGVLKCLAQLLENQDMSSGSQLVLVNDSAESIKINGIEMKQFSLTFLKKTIFFICSQNQNAKL